ncbi:oxidoreductase-like protein [Macroventuria anomochaeta]|uniref:Oxidoreductase-like protein n=1 Tax=Macroventuria anomochaeta TaxID=301207 RepID=A0ACB6SF13_9PLEO|nr:oxidoreductase-like protein [Macroventuria anomochaeta]KAF2632821.1 oxidoreductase-like protein [Macroventuria anomochaeta]
MSKPAIGFCGLGAMGLGMATNLVKQGYSVTGFDVYPPSLEKFQKAGGIPSTSLSESAKDKPFYIVMVASALQAQPALFADDGIVKALPKGTTLILMSTVPSSYAQSVEKELKDIGRDDIFFIDAPVSGGAGRAADGTLTIMAGASDAAFEKGKWLLAEMSAPSKLFIVEGGIGQGSNMKMVHQVLAAIQILAVSEAYGFGARLGLNGQDVSEAVIGSDAWSWMFENRTQRTLKEDYFPGASAVTIILKDTSIITLMARKLQYPTPLCSIAEQVYFAAVDRGWGANDDAGIVRLWTSEPVSSIQGSFSAEEKQQKQTLVKDLLKGIHLVAAAEALSLASHVNIPLAQIYELAKDAAGGSKQFEDFGPKMLPVLEGQSDSNGKILNTYIEKLHKALDEAQAIKCPLYLGNGALALLLQTGKSRDLASLLKFYTQ